MKINYKNLDYYINHAWQAEDLKSKAYEKYFAGKDLESKVSGLRGVLRCHFIKYYCCAKNNWGMIKKYKVFKAQWIKENSSWVDQEVMERI